MDFKTMKALFKELNIEEIIEIKKMKVKNKYKISYTTKSNPNMIITTNFYKSIKYEFKI